MTTTECADVTCRVDQTENAEVAQSAEARKYLAALDAIIGLQV
jgi:hypothetical protein